MGLVSRLLSGTIGPYLLLGLLVILVLVGAWGWVEHAEAGKAKAELATALLQVKNVTADNQTAQTTITSLTTALGKWKDSATDAAHKGAELTQQLADEQAALVAQNAKLTKQEQSDNALPNCQRLEAMDLAQLCPAHASSQRVRAANSLQGPGSH